MPFVADELMVQFGKQNAIIGNSAPEIHLNLFLLRVNFRRDFQAQAVQADEAGGVVLVVGLGRVGFHRGDVRIVEAHR